MLSVQNTSSRNLPELADCHVACFPESLSTKLGKSYVQKSLEWFLENTNRFLYHIISEDKVVGYCGGFVPVKVGDGSSSGMLQHAFKPAVAGIVKNPLLLFHSEVRHYYPFIWLNIKRKITGKAIPIKPADPAKPFKQKVGLVVIGVHPDSRGTGVAQKLLDEFEVRASHYNLNEMVLSVKTNNLRAIKAYQKSGWEIHEERNTDVVMHKFFK